MVTDWIKFTHLVVALCVLGLTLYALYLTIKGNEKWLSRKWDSWILGLLVVGAITGTFLVYPKHFTYHTPWIQGAYLLFAIAILGLLFNIISKTLIKKNNPAGASTKMKVVHITNYCILLLLLIVIIHDAVTKQTVLPTG